MGSWSNGLFRYRYFDEKGYHFKSVFDNTLRFSHPSSFNDPFDANIDLLVIRNLSEDKEKEIRKEIKSRYEKISVCCFSKSCQNNVMWHYYSDKHTGFVVEYNSKHPFFSKAFEVEYTDEFPVLDGNNKDFQNKDFTKLIRPIFLFKSEEWKHEQEVRMMHDEKSKNYSLEENMIQRVILGKDCTEKNEADMKEILSQSKFLGKIDLYKMKIQNESYKLIPNFINTYN